MAGSTAIMAPGVNHLRGARGLLPWSSSRGCDLMSGSAEVYISVDVGYSTRGAIETSIEAVLRDLGYDPANKERYQVGRFGSGIIVEARSYSVAWEIFEKDWAMKLVRDIAALDETADMELYVYNLEREADVQVGSRDLFSENHKEKAHA